MFLCVYFGAQWGLLAADEEPLGNIGERDAFAVNN